MTEARLYKKLENNRVHCRLCSQFCLIEDGERGLCGVRENAGGTLYTLVHDHVAAVNLDPVEKKPLYHFLPGTLTFSFGTQGCNFSCSFCQNDTLSQPPKSGARPSGRPATPEALVDAALESRAASISYTYSEPTIFFELMADTAVLAHEQGLKNILVSNGFQSPECLDELAGLIDAANIDLKAFTEEFYKEQCGARLDPVLKNLRHIRRLGWWLEVTTLVIPGLNDSDKELADIARFISGELGTQTPWHLSRFTPQYRLRDRPSTPTTSLERAHAIGKRHGLEYVYLGNVPGHPDGSTYCPGCGAKLIDRVGFALGSQPVTDGRCPACGHDIPGVWS